MNILLFCIIIIALFGQPNGLALLFPLYPFIAFGLSLLLLVIVLSKKLSRLIKILPHVNILFPLIIFIVYSIISLTYAPEPIFGLRIFVSMIFKIIFFLKIILICNQTKYLKLLLKIVGVTGAAFSLQGLLLILCSILFNIQPISQVNEMGGLGLLDYDYRLFYYGILGFGKQYINFFNFKIPRCQAMFTEPGWFANFLELSLFSTLGYYALEKKANLSKKIILWLQLLALFWSFSTAGWFSVGIGYLTYMLCINKTNKVFSKAFIRNLIIFIILSTIFIVIVSLFPTIIEDIYKIIWEEKFETAWGTASATQRLDVINLSLELFLENPLIGWGINQTKIINDGFGTLMPFYNF